MHPAPSSRVAVLGAGTMGRGIAQVFAGRGFAVMLYDANDAATRASLGFLRDTADALVTRGKLAPHERDALLERIIPTADLNAALDGVALVIEAAPEDMALKVDLFTRVVEMAPGDALLGSNTSSLSLTELGRCAAAPDRLLGLHFFNPPPLMELVEIVRGLGTSEASVKRALGWVEAIGKTPVVVRDVPGFATSRLGVLLGAEAMRMVEQGVASAADIDRAMELGYRHPMGPLKLTDLIGLDVRLAILEHLHDELGEAFRPPVLLRQMVRAGRLGKKTGLGFYRWTEKGPEPA